MQRLYGDNKNRTIPKEYKEYYELRDNNNQSPNTTTGNQTNPFVAKREAVARASAPSSSSASYVIPSSTDIMTRPEPKYTYEQPMPSRSFTPNPAATSSHVNDYTSATTIHCITIADHVMNCPICSKFYRDYSPFYKVVSLICIAILIGVLWTGYNKNKCTHNHGPSSHATSASPAIMS